MMSFFSFFQWRPLRPCARATTVPSLLSKWADRAALIFLGLGFIQVATGLDQGLLSFIPLALGILLFGLPHGAIDHLVALGLAGKPLRLPPLSAVLSLYLLVAFTVLGLWVVFPLGAAVGFLLMTIYHWGQGDLTFERLWKKHEVRQRGRWRDHVHWLLRGTIPIGIPFIAFPEQAGDFINACARLFSPDFETGWDLWRNIVTGLFIILFAADLGNHVRHFRDPLARRALIENFLLVAFFFWVPPLVAIGWYFAGWHGFRHILRLCHYQANNDAARHDLPATMLRRGQQAIPFTLLAVLMLAGLFMGLRDRVSSHFEIVALYLVLISALTLPHLVIVEWMDHREKP